VQAKEPYFREKPYYSSLFTFLLSSARLSSGRGDAHAYGLLEASKALQL
jgi:hypothetical protein